MTLRTIDARATAVALGLAALTACGGETLDQAFVPSGPTGPSSPDLGPLSPITPGLARTYFIAGSYKPEAVDSTTSPGEQQLSGYLCSKVTAVHDTATEQYKDEPQTIVVASLRVSGTGANNDVRLDEDALPIEDGPRVDASLEPLWLKRFTIKARGHGMLSPRSFDFSTRDGPARDAPAEPDPSRLFFFEVRDSLDLTWGGFDHYYDFDENNQPVTVHDNILNKVYLYFINELFAGDTTTFFQRVYTYAPSHLASCDGLTSSSTCTAGAGCRWDFAASTCTSYYVIELAWRETLTTGGVEIQGPVVHRLKLEYDAVGMLAYGVETIVPDATPGATTKPSPVSQCTIGEACLDMFLDPSLAPEFAGATCSF